MEKLEQARKLYLRGFGSKYIKQHTGISMQSLLKQLRAKGEVLSKADIVDYQIRYICENYTKDNICDAYRRMMRENDNPDKLRRGRHLHYLGCGFGNYPAVFRKLLGEDVYKSLRDECWKIKQVNTVRKRYGVDNVFDKAVFHTVASDEAIRKGREARTQTLLERYGCEHLNQNAEIASRMIESSKQTFRDKYGVDHPMKVAAIAQVATQHRQQTMIAKYGAGNSVEIKSIRDKIFAARKRNGTCSTSRAEDALYELLCDQFSDVQRNVVVDARYPWHVDFYIPSRNLFIELNGDVSHGGHWFDANAKCDQQRVFSWQQNSTTKPRYARMLRVWTETDVQKRNTARRNQLNYLVFWDATVCKINGSDFPRLLDARAWIADGCPDAKNWYSENTY